jgi:peroxiredoxin
MSPTPPISALSYLVLAVSLGALCWGGLVSGFAALSPIQAGNKIPWVDLHWNFPPQRVNVPSYTAGRNVIVVGLPGAFLPKGTQDVVPSYLDETHRNTLQNELGVDEVLIYAVNDGAVMRSYANKTKIHGSMVSMMGDPSGEFTKECGMQMEQVNSSLGTVPRSKPFAMYVVNNIVQYVSVGKENDCDPNDSICAPAMAEAIRKCQKGLKESQLEREKAWV